MRRVFLAAVALVVALSCAATAHPAATFAIRGHGWGHGLGLAQYGAYGYARDDGRTFQWIIDHYYPGTTLGAAGVGRVKVLLTEGVGQVSIASSAAYSVTDANGHTYNLNGTHTLRPNLRIVSANGQTRTLAGPIRFDPGGSPARGLGDLVSRPRARPGRRRPALRRRRPRPRAVRQGRRRPGDAFVLAPRGAQGPGGRRPHVCARQPEDRLLVQPLRRHPQSGLRRRPGRDRGHERGGRRHVGPGRPLGRRFRVDVLPLDVRREDGVPSDEWGPPAIPYLVSVPDAHDSISPHHNWGPPTPTTTAPTPGRDCVWTAAALKRALGSRAPNSITDFVVTARNSSSRVATATLSGRRRQRRSRAPRFARCLAFAPRGSRSEPCG